MRRAIPLLLLAHAACYQPSFEEELACSMGTLACPTGQRCEPNTHVCYPEGTTGVGAPTSLRFVGFPHDVVAGHLFGPVFVQVVDQRGHRVLTSSAEVRVELIDDNGNASSLDGTLMAPASMGEARFADLRIPGQGTGLRLRAFTDGLAPVTDAPLEVVRLAFEEPVALPAGGFNHYTSALAYVNSDSVLDIVLPNDDGSTISVYLSDGVGGLENPIDTEVGSQPRAVAVADFDLDGKADVAVSSHPGGPEQTRIFPGLGDGSFGTFEDSFVVQAVGIVYGMDAGDIDGDTKPDLVTTGPGDNQDRTVWFNNTSPSDHQLVFEQKTLSCSGVNSPIAVAVRDIDGDQLLDVVTSGHEGLCTFRRNPADGRTFFPAQPRPATNFNPTMTLAELTGDLLLEAIAYDGSNMLRWFMQNTAGEFDEGMLLRSSGAGTTVVAGRIDADGLDDLVLSDHSGTAIVMLQDPSLQFTSFNLFVGTDIHSAAAGDVTGDGITDVVLFISDGLRLYVGR